MIDSKCVRGERLKGGCAAEANVAPATDEVFGEMTKEGCDEPCSVKDGREPGPDAVAAVDERGRATCSRAVGNPSGRKDEDHRGGLRPGPRHQAAT